MLLLFFFKLIARAPASEISDIFVRGEDGVGRMGWGGWVGRGLGRISSQIAVYASVEAVFISNKQQFYNNCLQYVIVISLNLN